MYQARSSTKVNTFFKALLVIRHMITNFSDAFQETIKQFKNVDILINNAGILNDAILEKQIAVNVVSIEQTFGVGFIVR